MNKTIKASVSAANSKRYVNTFQAYIKHSSCDDAPLTKQESLFFTSACEQVMQSRKALKSSGIKALSERLCFSFIPSNLMGELTELLIDDYSDDIEGKVIINRVSFDQETSIPVTNLNMLGIHATAEFELLSEKSLTEADLEAWEDANEDHLDNGCSFFWSLADAPGQEDTSPELSNYSGMSLTLVSSRLLPIARQSATTAKATKRATGTGGRNVATKSAEKDS